MKQRRTAIGLSDEPQWYKDAVIYEVRVRSYMDSDGDGIGDLAGLTEKLPYLEDLGVTALWLLPLCPSPGRDDGYDISDYYDVHRDVGTLDDFKRFLDEAHRRGLRVITELVLNHTSDAHPWFQRARRAPPGSSERDFYVWSDTAERYKGARIIFKDFEHSNWTWDHVAKAYFWHRFYSHQPDLNYDNPAVHDAALDVCDFWYSLGVDGLRLDAVPYLYEREGTNCENLAETHAFLKKLRAHVDARFANRMLLAEANQWPEDAAQYFGDGDECHMNFHFPIMPRIFMSIHKEDRFPIMDIMAQTPQIPENCQWAMFLRNHDELTLEMVTDEERDYMYSAYAHDPVMRINLGIRRRLAPLCGNDRKNVELMNGLLFALPGTPVIYYGDEIGMGDNIYLGDRNGVRTPMQWSPDRNAGFSRANPQKMILPIVIDPEYHFEAVNVEAQQNNVNSLLWWTKKAVALRKRFKAFGRGTIEFLTPENHRVLAFLRRYEDELVLVVANLSRFAQCVELNLAEMKGMIPMELSGGTRFPPIGEQPYLITLGGRAFYWFSIEKPKHAEAHARAEAYQPPTIEVKSWLQLFSDDRAQLEDALPAWLEGRSWFTGRGRPVKSVTLQDAVPLTDEAPGTHAVVFAVEYAQGEIERYVVTLAFVEGEEVGALRARSPHAIVANVRPATGVEGPHGAVFDAASDPPASLGLLTAIESRIARRTGRGAVKADLVAGIAEQSREPHLIRPERGNAAVIFGDQAVLKLFRRMDDGPSPELEILRRLSQREEQASTPRLLGSLGYRPVRGDEVTLAILTGYVPNEGSAWQLTREELGRYYERVLTMPRDAGESPRPERPLLELARQDPPPGVREILGPYVDQVRIIGARVAELHAALRGPQDDPDFAPEPYSPLDKRSIYQTMRNMTGTVLRALRVAVPHLDPGGAMVARDVLAREEELYVRIRALLDTKVTALRSRCHGDLHLGQLLSTGKDFVITDFEGDRTQPVAQRRRKRSPLRDVASMVVSFHRAAFSVLLDEGSVRPGDRPVLRPWADVWATWCSSQFVRWYLDAASSAPQIPQEHAELVVLLDSFVLERALWEVGRELERGSPNLEAVLEILLHVLHRGPTLELDPGG